MSEWRAIETAPLDGTRVLVNDTTSDDGVYVMAYWLSGFDWSGWAYDDELLNDTNPTGPKPTHWFPVPPLTIARATGETA
jgi:hypothetical protein